MTEITYTKSLGPDSTTIEGIYYNANEGFAVLDIQDRMYRYDDVTEEQINALMGADSVGAHYNTVWKKEHKGGTYLGLYGDVRFHRVPLEATPIPQAPSLVQNEWTGVPVGTDDNSIATPEVSLAPVADVVDIARHRGAKVEETTEVSLKVPFNGHRWLVTFLVGEKENTVTIRELDVLDVIDAFYEVLSALDVDAEITAVERIG